MKITSGTLALIMALGCAATVPAIAQDHHDQPQAEDHQNREESGYYKNKNYKKGWQDGQQHKHKDHKWKNDADKQAYEAGYNHGDHGDQWKDHR